MTLYRWDPGMETGVEEIDEQHKMFFDMLNELHDKTQAGEAKQGVLDALQGMRTYAAFHFEAEEAMMREAGYPKLERHAARHREFLQTLDALDAEALSDASEAANKALAFLRDWFLNHIRVGDFEFCSGRHGA